SDTVQAMGHGRTRSMASDLIHAQTILHGAADHDPDDSDPVARRAARASLGKLWIQRMSHMDIATDRDFAELFVGLEPARLLETEQEPSDEVIPLERRDLPVRIATVAELDVELATALQTIQRRTHDPVMPLEQMLDWRAHITRAQEILNRV